MTTLPLQLNSELFLIPSQDSYLVYAPRRHYVMRLSAEGVNLLVRIQTGRARDGDADSEFVKSLVQAGIINGPPETKPPPAVGAPYAPTRVTLLLTNQCNLACQYCYASGQPTDQLMPVNLGKAAIDFIAANCLRAQKKIFDVGFHGGGEPTTAWKELTALTAYAQTVALDNGLTLRLGVATNACISREKAEWIARNFSNVNISLDGPPEIQNRQRPTKGGGPSFDRVQETLRCLERAGTPYGIQVTVTKETVAAMAATVRYLAEHFKPTMVKFEPVTDCGRFLGRADEIPPPRQFADSFNQAYEMGQQVRLNVAFSGSHLFGEGLCYFCGAFGEPFAVTPDGHVSACYEAYSAEAPYAATFLFGRFDAPTSRFIFDLEKLETLRQRNVDNLDPCRKCFCKYSCGGDCATRNFHHTGGCDLNRVGVRCEMIREITRYGLARIVERANHQPDKKEAVYA